MMYNVQFFFFSVDDLCLAPPILDCIMRQAEVGTVTHTNAPQLAERMATLVTVRPHHP